jgi:hypothetical protein
MKCFYEYAAMAPATVDARRADGRVATQVRRAFLAPSISQAIKLIDEFGWNRRWVNEYVTVTDDIAPGVPLDQYEPGTVLVAQLDSGDTIDGTEGWRPYEKRVANPRS